MKLTKALKKKGCPFLVPDCSRDSLPEFFKELGFKTGVEIGVWEGEFTAKFCRAGIKMCGVDPWMARGKQNQHQCNARYGRALVLLSPMKCNLIRKTSMEALEDFDDESLDFVYIDGDHRYASVVNDIREWSKKVRSGGIISGHDYACMETDSQEYKKHKEVAQAVDEYIKSNGIENFYIFGRSKPLKEEVINDRLLSWFFIKN